MRFVASALAVVAAVAAVPAATTSAATTSAGSAPSTTAPSTTAPSTTTPTHPDGITWGVQPATAKGPTGKPAFVYNNVTPGTTIHGYVGVTNYSKVPATFAIYPADAVNTTTGGFSVVTQGQRSVGVGAWTTLARSSVAIPAGIEDNIPFTIQVPTNATPGDHYGGIIAQYTSTGANRKSRQVRLRQRVGVRIYLRVVGPLHPELSIEHLALTYDGTANPFGSGSATVHYTVANTGNVALAAAQAVTITSIFGTLASARLSSIPPAGSARQHTTNRIVNLVPGQSQQVTITLDGVPPAGPIDANVTLVPSVPKGTTTAPHPKLPAGRSTVGRSTGTWAWPWPQLILFVVVVALLWLWRRRRKRRGSKLERAVAAAREEGRREGEATAKTEDGESPSDGTGNPPKGGEEPSGAEGGAAGHTTAGGRGGAS